MKLGYARVSTDQVDPRCLQFDHHFAEDDLYDYDDTGCHVPLPREAQLAARCVRCGVTMRGSLLAMIQEMKTPCA